MAHPGLFDTIYSLRAMRRLKPDSVPDELIRELLEAAICAPSGGDSQHWRFIVVKDPAIKKELQIGYKRAFEDLKERFMQQRLRPAKPRSKTASMRTTENSRWVEIPDLTP